MAAYIGTRLLYCEFPSFCTLNDQIRMVRPVVRNFNLFVDDGSIYVMSITTEWQNAPKGDEGNWIKIRIN